MNHPRQCSNLPPDANSRFLAPLSAVIAGPGRETLEAHLPEHEVSESSTLQYLRNNRWRDGAVVRRASVPTLVKKRCKHVQCRLPEIHAMPVQSHNRPSWKRISESVDKSLSRTRAMSRDSSSSAPPGGRTPASSPLPPGPIPRRICLRRQRNLRYHPSNLRRGEPTRAVSRAIP